MSHLFIIILLKNMTLGNRTHTRKQRGAGIAPKRQLTKRQLPKIVYKFPDPVRKLRIAVDKEPHNIAQSKQALQDTDALREEVAELEDLLMKKRELLDTREDQYEEIERRIENTELLNSYIRSNTKPYEDFEHMCQRKIDPAYGESLINKTEVDPSYYTWYIQNIPVPGINPRTHGFLIARELSATTLFIKLVCSDRGSGSKVITNVLVWAKANGFTHICLEAISDAVVEIYEKIGFKVIYDERLGSFNEYINSDPNSIIVPEDEANIMMIKYLNKRKKEIDWGNTKDGLLLKDKYIQSMFWKRNTAPKKIAWY